MQPELELTRLFPLADVYPLNRPTMMAIIRILVVPKGNIENVLSLLQAFRPTLGACMTCMAMSGSGVRTGMGIILQDLLPILPVLRAVRTVWVAAAPGAAAPGTVVQRFVSGTLPVSGSSTWASAS